MYDPSSRLLTDFFFIECTISYVEECTLQEKTNRQCRLRELLLEKSKDASLVVM